MNYKKKRFTLLFFALSISLLTVFLTSCGEPQDKLLYKFRNTNWEMNKEDVIKAEGRDPDKEADVEQYGMQYTILTYEDVEGAPKYEDKKVKAQYHIRKEDNVLENAYYDYSFKDESGKVDKEELLKAYPVILKEIENQFGKPTIQYTQYEGNDGPALEHLDLEIENPIAFDSRWNGKQYRFLYVSCYVNTGQISIEYRYHTPEEVKAIKDYQP